MKSILAVLLVVGVLPLTALAAEDPYDGAAQAKRIENGAGIVSIVSLGTGAGLLIYTAREAVLSKRDTMVIEDLKRLRSINEKLAQIKKVLRSDRFMSQPVFDRLVYQKVTLQGERQKVLELIASADQRLSRQARNPSRIQVLEEQRTELANNHYGRAIRGLKYGVGSLIVFAGGLVAVEFSNELSDIFNRLRVKTSGRPVTEEELDQLSEPLHHLLDYFEFLR